jgi:hypothetical protein
MDAARLQIEKFILQKYFPDRYAFVGLGTPNSYLDVGLLSNNNKAYRLKIPLPSDYPNSVPKVYLTYPKPLYNFAGRKLSEIGTDHDLHILSPDSDGNIQLCHYKSSNWKPHETTLYLVALKCLVWINAYEGHLRTGKGISQYVGD